MNLRPSRLLRKRTSRSSAQRVIWCTRRNDHCPSRLSTRSHCSHGWRLCHQELRFNQRFSDDVYLRIETIEADGEVVDYAVVMRRMPAGRRLSTLVTEGADAEPCVVAVAKQLAGFHSIAARSPTITAFGTHAAVSQLWRLSLDELHAFDAVTVDPVLWLEISVLANEYLAGRQPMFDRRVATRQIVDGHGDLLSDDIYCLDDGPRLLDCLEFGKQFRCGDVLLDVAFLVMDLERLGGQHLAHRFIAAYDEFTDEHHPLSLIEHYVAYRALVRAKVLAYRARSGAPGALEDAHRLLRLAAHHLRIGETRLVVIGGMPGTGKTTLAELLSRHTGWAVLSSDAIRREVAGPPDRVQGFGEGGHAPEVTQRTYELMFHRAAVALGLGESVIVDASFSDERWRTEARQTAKDTHSALVELCCDLPADSAADRIRKRSRSLTSEVLSDATPEIATIMSRRAAPWPSATRIDTDGAPEESVAQALIATGLPRTFQA